MPCPLLDKLAPETRNLIYEYVLSFEVPVQHVTKMRPFLQKLTRGASTSEDEYEWEDVDLQSTRAEPGSSTDATGKLEPLRRVNTSILTASKLIYTEAVAVFYKRNIISVDPHFCDLAALESPRATDLSLATHVLAKIDIRRYPNDPRISGGMSPAMRNAINIALVGFPGMFPKLLSSKIYLIVDAIHILKIAGLIRQSPNSDTASFDGVGNLTASWSTHPQLEFFVQDPETMERWAAEPDDDVPLAPRGRFSDLDISSPLLWRAWRVDRGGVYASYARQMFQAVRHAIVPEVYQKASPNMFEFWTVVDGCLSILQTHASRASQAGRS
jgi:hypothetical protein